MNRKSLLVVSMAIILLAGFACGKSSYSEYKGVLSDLIASKEKFIADIQGASKADDFVKATKAYITSAKKFKEQRSSIFVKYPELTDNVAMPADVTQLLEKSSNLEAEIDKVLVPAATKYQSDPNAISAWEELSRTRVGL